VNFTREPIILSVITPKEGSKIVLKNSKGKGQEDFFVDAVEIISFGDAVFFRSTEKPKSFLLPVNDYEVLEVKETKMVLKNVSIDRTIKIGGGKEPQKTKQKDQGRDNKLSTKNKKLKQRRKQLDNKPLDRKPLDRQESKIEPKGGDTNDETEVSSSILRKLFPPPNTLIKERLNSYKSKEDGQGDILSEEIIEEKEVVVAEKVQEEIAEPIKEEAVSEEKIEEKLESDKKDTDKKIED
jgi:hypothetical protein